MALGRPWQALVGWFNHLVGRERQTWVEPGNAITRAVLSGVELTLPDLPVRRGSAWVPPEEEAAFPAAAASTGTAAPAPASESPVPPAGDEEPKPGRWRAA